MGNCRKLSLVVPVFNNSGSLRFLWAELKAVRNQLINLDVEIEAIFVNDGSTDGSLAVLKSLDLSDQDQIINLSRNFGAVNASHQGLMHASGDSFTIIAADLQDPPNLIIDMVNSWISGSAFVVCTRSSRKDGFISKFFSKLFYIAVRKMIFNNFPKGGFDLFLMDSKYIDLVRNSQRSEYLPLLLWSIGEKPTVIPYIRGLRVHGKSGWNLGKKLEAFLDCMLIFSINPMRLIMKIAFILSLFFFAYGVIILTSAVQGNRPVPGFASIIIILSLFGGISLSLFSLIVEMLWRILQNSRKFPRSIVSDIFRGKDH